MLTLSFLNRLPIAISLVSLATLMSCSSAPTSVSSNEMASQEASISTAADSASGPTGEPADLTIPTIGAARTPQLVKHAFLHIELADVDAAIESISDILAQHQGDLLQLSDQEMASNAPRQVSVELRVPQTNLDPVLEALRSLGSVTNQSISADDVSTQLVDLQARIRNLRKSEEALLEIMERTGEIADVLEVSRELSTVREAIERNEAQLKTLQTRVAYSTISLMLISTQQPIPDTSPVGEILGQTWQTATFSVRTLSVGLLQLLLWLLVFSPYIAIALLSLWAGRRYWRAHRTSAPSTES